MENKKELQLKGEAKSFTNASGRKVTYVALYVEIFGVKVALQAKDETGRQLLSHYFRGNDSETN